MAEKGEKCGLVTRHIERLGAGLFKPLSGGLHGAGSQRIFLGNRREDRAGTDQASIATVIKDDDTIGQRGRVAVGGKLGDQGNSRPGLGHDGVGRDEAGY